VARWVPRLGGIGPIHVRDGHGALSPIAVARQGSRMDLIRDFHPEDVDALVDILKANQQYSHPEIDGPEAMLRVAECQAAEFLVASRNGRPVGLIRGTYDGSRAIIYLASVHPDCQRQGVGRALMTELALRFSRRGASSIAVIAPGGVEFWRALGFRQTTRVMQVYPIEHLLPIQQA